MAKIGKEYIDDLTGLYNRRYLLLEAIKKLKSAEQKGMPLSIVFIDLDHFKNVNDTYGHSRGDVVLKEFGEFLKRELRQNDTVYRYGGDEFICILPNADHAQAVMVSGRFMNRCRAKEFAKNRLTLSIGIASFPENAGDWKGLFELADRNLYSAKRHGRDQIGTFKEGEKGLIIPTEEIIGREEEIATAKRFINPIFSGNGGTVCISGEVGVGKTRLVNEIARDADLENIPFLSSNLSATTKSIPYYPIREVLRAIALRTIIDKKGTDITREIPRAYQIELAKIVPELSNKSKGRDEHIFMVDKFRLFEGVRRLLALQCSKEPLLICIDNSHWADDGSLELFHYLVRTLRDNPVFFLLIYRVEEVGNSSLQRILQLMGRECLYEEINLEALETAGVARMLSLIIDGNPSLELTNYIYRETGGNPFFIEELMKSLESNGALFLDNNEWVFDRSKEIVIPYSLEDVVLRKLGMMDSEAHNLLEYAAVIGREFDFALLRDITKMNEGHLFDLMDGILEVRLLKESGGERYCFSEDVIREIIYKEINEAKLKHYHEIVGEELSRLHKGRVPEIAEELSSHFFISGDRERAIKYSIIAGDKAKASYANQDAIRFYTRAIKYLPKSKVKNKEIKEIESLRNRANVLNLIGENKKAIGDLKEAIKKAKVIRDKKEEADCLIALCKAYLYIARYNKATKKAEMALEIYKELKDKKGETKCLNYIGVAYWYLDEYKDALEFYQSSLKIAKELSDREGEAMALGNIAINYWNLGKYHRALKYYKNSLEITKEIGNRQTEGIAFNNIGLIYATLSNYSKALEYYENSLAITKEIGARAIEASSLNNIGIIYADRSEYHKALEYYDSSLKITKEISDRKVEAMNLNNIGVSYGNLGEYSTSLKYCKSSLKIAKDIGDRKTEAESLIGIGNTYLEANNFSNAKKYYSKAYSIVREIESKPLLADISLVTASFFIEKDDLTEAKKRLKQGVSLAFELDAKRMKACGLCLSGRLYTKEKEWDNAEPSFSQSAEIFKRLKNKFELAKVYYYQGLMFKESGDKINSKKYFTKATKIFKKLGAKGWILKVEKTFP